MKKTGLVFILCLGFLVSCICHMDSSDEEHYSLSSEPKCKKFDDEAYKFCKDLGVWFEDERCRKKWDKANGKCRELVGTQKEAQDDYVVPKAPPYFLRVLHKTICGEEKKIKKVKK